MSDGGATSSSVGLNFCNICSHPDVVWFLLIGYASVSVGLVYQYGHASRKWWGITVESDIDNFDKL